MCLLLWVNGMCLSQSLFRVLRNLKFSCTLQSSSCSTQSYSFFRWKCDWNRNYWKGSKAQEEALAQNHRAEYKQPQCLWGRSEVWGEEPFAQCGLWLIWDLGAEPAFLICVCLGLKGVKYSTDLFSVILQPFSKTDGQVPAFPQFFQNDWVEEDGKLPRNLIQTFLSTCSNAGINEHLFCTCQAHCAALSMWPVLTYLILITSLLHFTKRWLRYRAVK